MRYLIGVLCFGWSLPLTARESPNVCVRNYAAIRDICAKGLPGFAYAHHAQSDAAKVCVRVYRDQFCKDHPDLYDHVKGATGQVICTFDYFSPYAANQCAMHPESFVYAAAAWALPRGTRVVRPIPGHRVNP